MNGEHGLEIGYYPANTPVKLYAVAGLVREQQVHPALRWRYSILNRHSEREYIVVNGRRLLYTMLKFAAQIYIRVRAVQLASDG